MGGRIEWPKEYQKRWLDSASEHLLVTEPRTAHHWQKCLRARKTTLAERAYLLGGPEVPVPRTMEGCKREIQAYFDANEKRPSVTTSAEWQTMDSWLRRQGSSLSPLCDEMGLPALVNLERTIDDCKREVRAYYDANGKRPTQGTSKEWGNVQAWLKYRGTSLSLLCDEMGLPTLMNLERTIEDCKREVRAYYDANGRCPSERVSVEWGKRGSWLRRQGSSLSQLCDKMGLPALVNLERTIGDCKREIQAYYDANGKRPTQRASAEWRCVDEWLHNRGSSLCQLCDEMGLPALLNLKRSMGGCKREIQAYYDANGKRPTDATSVEWRKMALWLRYQGTSISRLCDKMELPALRNSERTIEDCKREVQAYFDANGKRPAQAKEWGNINAWLKYRGSSLRQLCDEMGLPLYHLERSMEDCKREIQAYFKANGVRPTQKTFEKWRSMNSWLHLRGSSLSQLCDELGLPALLNLKRTMGDCVREVHAYYKTNRRRPSCVHSKEMGAWHSWLRGQGTTLSQLCDELGLPALKNRSRSTPGSPAYTLEDCDELGLPKTKAA